MNFSNIRDDQYHYDQQNPAWRDLPCFNPERGARIGDSGCGIVSMASCISYLYNDYITPDIVLERMEASGVQYGAEECASWRTPTAIAEEFGMCAAPLETIYDVVDALGAGNLVWCGGRGPWFEPDNEELREHGHCVHFYFFDGKYFYCHDSAHGRRTSFYTWDQMADVVANKRSGLFEIGF